MTLPSRSQPRTKWSIDPNISVMLAGNTVPLSTFLEAVGREVYGREWPADAHLRIRCDGSSRKDPSALKIHRVHDDLINAFYSEIIEVFFYHKARVKGRPLGRPLSGITPDLGTEAFILRPEFWTAYQNSERIINWGTSSTIASWTDVWWSRTDYILRHASTANLDDQVEPFTEARCQLLIRNPKDSFEKLFQSIAVPDKDWFNRYRIYRNKYTLELVAAGWRYLAVKRPKDCLGIGVELEKALQAYLVEQRPNDDANALLSDPAVKNIASRILAQWRAVPPTQKSVLVNTSLHHDGA